MSNFNSKRMSLMKYGAIFLCLYCLSALAQEPPVVNRQLTSSEPPYILHAGTIDGKSDKDIPKALSGLAEKLPTGLRVKLVWLSTKGWVPGVDGFNIIRSIGGGAPKKLNEHPIVATPDRIESDPRMTPYKGVFARATRSVSNHTPEDLFQFQGAVQAESSYPWFQKLKAEMTRQDAAPNALSIHPASRLRTALESEAVRPYAERLGATRAARAKVALANKRSGGTIVPVDPAEDVRLARTALGVGALSNAELAEQLGLSFTDTEVKLDDTVTYTLVKASNGAQLAQTTIHVGHDPMPSAPDNFDAVQIGVGQVSFNWTQTPMDAKSLVETFKLTRIDATGTAQLVQDRIWKSTSEDRVNKGGAIEPIFTFIDRNAPVGLVTYEIQAIDTFGRVSKPLRLTTNVADWSTPHAVESVEVSLNAASNAPQIFWPKSLLDPTAKYRVYRVSADTGGINSKVRTISKQGPGTWAGGLPVADVSFNYQEGTPPPPPPTPKIPAYLYTLGKVRKPDQSTRPRAIAVPFLTFTDKSAVPDHYYRYVVTAVFPGNLRDSAPTESSIVGVPLLTGPAMPSNIVTKTGDASAIAMTGTPEWTGHHPITLGTIAGKQGFRRSYTPPASVKSRPGYSMMPMLGSDVGKIVTKPVTPAGLKAAAGGFPIPSGSQSYAQVRERRTSVAAKIGVYCNLTWNDPGPAAPGAPYTYSVYRVKLKNIPMKGLVGGMPLEAGHPASTRVISRLRQRRIEVESKFGKTPAASEAAFSPELVKKNLAMDLTSDPVKQALSGLPINGRVLMRGVTVGTSFEDYRSDSQTIDDSSSEGEQMAYVILPRNHWGVDGTPAVVTAHLPPSAAPTAPVLRHAMPSLDHPEQILLVLDPPDVNQDIASYQVFANQASVKITDPNDINEIKVQQLQAIAAAQTWTAAAKVDDASVQVSNSSDGPVITVSPDKSHPFGFDYFYRVVAVNSSGISSSASAFHGAHPGHPHPPIPSIQSATCTPQGVQLTGTATMPIYSSEITLTVVRSQKLSNGAWGPYVPISWAIIYQDNNFPEARLQSAKAYVDPNPSMKVTTGQYLITLGQPAVLATDATALPGQTYRYQFRGWDSPEIQNSHASVFGSSNALTVTVPAQ